MSSEPPASLEQAAEVTAIDGVIVVVSGESLLGEEAGPRGVVEDLCGKARDRARLWGGGGGGEEKVEVADTDDPPSSPCRLSW